MVVYGEARGIKEGDCLFALNAQLNEGKEEPELLYAEIMDNQALQDRNLNELTTRMCRWQTNEKLALPEFKSNLDDRRYHPVSAHKLYQVHSRFGKIDKYATFDKVTAYKHTKVLNATVNITNRSDMIHYKNGDKTKKPSFLLRVHVSDFGDRVHLLNATMFGEQAERYLDCGLEAYQKKSARDRDTLRREREQVRFNVWIDTRLNSYNEQESLQAIVKKIEETEE